MPVIDNTHAYLCVARQSRHCGLSMRACTHVCCGVQHLTATVCKVCSFTVSHTNFSLNTAPCYYHLSSSIYLSPPRHLKPDLPFLAQSPLHLSDWAAHLHTLFIIVPFSCFVKCPLHLLCSQRRPPFTPCHTRRKTVSANQEEHFPVFPRRAAVCGAQAARQNDGDVFVSQ